MIYTVGNTLSIIGFSICLAYCVLLIVLAVIKKIRAKKEINKVAKAKSKEVSNSETQKVDYKG